MEYEKTQAILVCTDLSIRAEDIITAYAHRFKIEAMFREMKQCFGGFCYRFRSKAVPKLERYLRTPSRQVMSEASMMNISGGIYSVLWPDRKN